MATYSEGLETSYTSRLPQPGEEFGSLTVLGTLWLYKTGKAHRYRVCLCRCKCGLEVRVRSTNLRNGDTNSCGCEKGWRSHLKKSPPMAYFQERQVLAGYKLRSKVKGLPFNITLPFFLDTIVRPCYYCGAPPSNSRKEYIRQGKCRKVVYSELRYSGLDRVDSSLGYTEDNVVPSCVTCNVAKGEMSQGDFISWVHKAHYSLACREGE